MGEAYMPITDFLIRNAKLYPDDIALIEANPEVREARGYSPGVAL